MTIKHIAGVTVGLTLAYAITAAAQPVRAGGCVAGPLDPLGPVCPDRWVSASKKSVMETAPPARRTIRTTPSNPDIGRVRKAPGVDPVANPEPYWVRTDEPDLARIGLFRLTPRRELYRKLIETPRTTVQIPSAGERPLYTLPIPRTPRPERYADPVQLPSAGERPLYTVPIPSTPRPQPPIPQPPSQWPINPELSAEPKPEPRQSTPSKPRYCPDSCGQQ